MNSYEFCELKMTSAYERDMFIAIINIFRGLI